MCYTVTMVCLTCGSKTNNPKFCSSSCSATYNNKNLPKRKKTKECKSCKELIVSSRTYCKNCWSTSIISSLRINEWVTGSWSGGTNYGLSETIRQYLIKEANFSCQQCSFNTVHPKDNKTILEINHIDGNGTNHSKDNLEVLCPNCHALTDTYRGRNVGNGRPVSYRRVSKI
jgi:5-methylcytosine-specific restriction endonuclease McrA